MDREEFATRLHDAAERLDVLSDGFDDAIGSWASGDSSDGDLRDAVMEWVVKGFDHKIEVSVNVSCCCDSFFDMKLDEGFRTDEEVHRYLKRDWSELVSPMIGEFSEGFDILCCMEELGMHDEAMAFVSDIARSIDEELAEGAYFDNYVNGCLRIVSDRMAESIAQGSPVAWMDRGTSERRRHQVPLHPAERGSGSG